MAIKEEEYEKEQEEEEDDDREEQEEALVALIEHRTKEVAHLRNRLSYYTSQLEEAEKRLQDTKRKLARLRNQDKKSSLNNGTNPPKAKVKVEEDAAPIPTPISKSKLLISSAKSDSSPPSTSNTKPSIASTTRASPPVSVHSRGAITVKRDPEDVKIKDRGTKRKLEQKEHKELIPSICSSSSPCTIQCHTSTHISSQHKRKLRTLVPCPVNDTLFVTSALDGIINFWQIQGKGSGASLLSSTDCVSPSQRRWPEDVAWHPEGNSLFSVYSADGRDSQVSVLNLNKTQGRSRVTFLDEKPHVKGIINSISFMPWEDTCFITGGSDHAVVFWREEDDGNTWKAKALHRHFHSSAVMGVAGMRQKQVVLSVGADRRIFGFDCLAGRLDFKHQIESKCMSILPNPCDFNLFMVLTGAPERQLRLFDIRLRQTELHAFGWKQQSSESQSALINQAWSPDGLFITSGSADPMIHIFDIRYNSRKPSQSVRAHQKRVFKAVWHQSLPLLVSISSDLNIGFHRIS